MGADGHLGRSVRQLLADLDVRCADRASTPADVALSDTVVNAASGDPDVVRAWAQVGREARGYVDACPTDASHAAVPRGDGAPVVPGVGWLSTLGDALAVVAAARLVGPVRADVTGWVPSRTSVMASATPRERREWWDAVDRRMQVLDGGDVVEERIAEHRRLAWFPRPVGPHHAAGVPGPHWRTIPQVITGLDTVRTALALPSTTAELLQGLGNLSRLRTRLGRPPRGRRPARRDTGTGGERWAVVVEVATARRELARAWAYGHDRHDVTARLVARVAGELQGGGHRAARTLGVTELVAAEALLDDLAAVTDLRWSVTRDEAS